MKHVLLGILLAALTGCAVARYPTGSLAAEAPPTEPPIMQSLFADKNATISEENIQKILKGTYRLPASLRVALVRLDNEAPARRYYWADEQYVKSQQAYADQFTAQLQQAKRVTKVTVLPELLISGTPTFTSIREAAVRTQADVAVVYTVTSDVYANYRLFAKSEIKAFATTQLLVLDTRTGLIPFAATSTRDAQATRQTSELNTSETTSRVKREAAVLTIEELGRQLATFLAGG